MASTARQRNAAHVRTLMIPGPKVRMHSLGRGLLLRVTKRGAGSWIQRIQVHGTRRDIALGPANVVALADARRQCDENKARVILGTGELVGIAGRRAAARSIAPEFAEFATQVVEEKWEAGDWKTPRQRDQWMHHLAKWAAPIGAIPVDRVSRSDVLTVFTQPVRDGIFWSQHPAVARHVLQRVAAIFNVAAAREMISMNPADPNAIRAALPRNGGARTRHHEAIGYRDLPAFLAGLDNPGRNKAAVLATKLIAFTAARLREVLDARWAEVDLDERIWTIPASRCKVGRDHRVTLSGAAIAVLKQAEVLRDPSGYVFPGRAGRPVSDQTVRRLFGRGTPHGLRSGLRVFAAEQCPDIPGDVAEAALGHRLGDKVEQAYLRTTLEAARADLMQRYADFLAGNTKK